MTYQTQASILHKQRDKTYKIVDSHRIENIIHLVKPSRDESFEGGAHTKHNLYVVT